MPADETSRDASYRRIIARDPEASIELGLGLASGTVTNVSLTSAALPPAYLVDADAVLLATIEHRGRSEDVVVHIEAQAKKVDGFRFRMAHYLVRLIELHPRRRVFQVVLAVAPAARSLPTGIHTGDLHLDWTVVDVGAVDGMAWASRLPALAAAAATADEDALCRAIAAAINALDPEEAAKATIDAVLLAGHHSRQRAVRLSTYKEIPMSRDQLIYSEYLAPVLDAERHAAEAKGRAEGRAEGRADLLAQVLAVRFTLGSAVLERVRALDEDGLVRLGAAAFDLADATALDVWLDANS